MLGNGDVTMGVAHRDSDTVAPLGVWWFDDRLRHHYVVDDDAQKRGHDRIAVTFDLRGKNHPDTSPIDIWTELRDDLGAASIYSNWWEAVDIDDDPRQWLQREVGRWMTWRFGRGVNSQLKSPTQQHRYRFAARRGPPLARAALALGRDEHSKLQPVLPSHGERISSRIVTFVDDSDERLVVVVGCQEPPKETQLALAYSLALLNERELRLVLPAGTEWPTLSRLPWLDISARVFVHNGDDPESVREVPIPTRPMVFDQHSDKIVTHIADLGDRAEWVCEFTDQADAHPELVTAHRPSYLAWHCRGRSVLDIRRTKPGLGIRAGVVSSKPGDTPFSPGVELDIGGPLKNSEHASLVRGVEVAVAERLDGTDATHAEHRFQARLAHSEIGSQLSLSVLLREFPAFRPGAAKPRRSYIDFLARSDDGTVHVVETKIGHDPMIALQALDYFIWAEAHRSAIAKHLGAGSASATRVDLVVMRPQGRSLVDDATRAVLDRLSRPVRWRVFEAVGDLDGDLILEPVARSRTTTGQRWADVVDRRVSSATLFAGETLARGWFAAPGDGFAPGAEDAATQLIARGDAHTHLAHVRSSQRFALNLFGPLERPGVARLLQEWFGPMQSVHLPEFEWTDPDDRLGESTSGRPYQTQVDVILAGTTKKNKRVAALVEVKLTETSFSGCSHANVAPVEARGICITGGPFGGAPTECWQLRNRDSGDRRRYDEHLELTQTSRLTAGGCWFRSLNQPMRLAALAKALEDDGAYAHTVVALTVPAGHRSIRRQWRDAKEMLGPRLTDLEPADVTAALPPAAAQFMLDRYGVAARLKFPSEPEPTIEITHDLRESLGWRLVSELINRSPKGLHVFETHPPGGPHDCLSLHDGSGGHVLDLDRNGALLIAGVGSSPDIWELLVSEGPEAIADDIEQSWLIDIEARPVPNRSMTVSLLADLAASNSHRGWTWHSGMFDPGEGPLGPGPIAPWFWSLDDLPDGVLGTMTSSFEPIDRPEFRFWFLVRELHEQPVVAVDAAGAGWVKGTRWALADDRDRHAFIAAALQAVTAAK